MMTIDMIALYAKCSKNNPLLHVGVITVLFIIFNCSVYLLLDEGDLLAFLGVIMPLPFFFLFSKSSEYKRKYLHK